MHLPQWTARGVTLRYVTHRLTVCRVGTTTWEIAIR